ncbi:MAG TPA: sensor histidine kinase [Thermoanaerobaculia bacterium]|nr:sensor histidine kinase [Thermoanaerobaculia bacterium]
MYSPQSRAERLIAGGRVVLAASSLFAVWFDPSEPAKYAPIAYSLLGLYVIYSVVIASLVWRSDAPSNRQGVITHCFDFLFFSLFIYFTAGPTSPFTVYFVFSLVCATLRWQWRGTLWTAVASIATFLSLGIYFAEVVRDPLFQGYPLIVRGVYLAVVAVLLGYLGAHEAQTRRDMARIAAWPQAEPRRIEPLARILLEHAAQTVGAPRALLAWVEREEPWLYIAEWSAGHFGWSRSAPGEQGLAADALAGSSFLAPDTSDPECHVLRKSAAGLARWRGAPVPSALRERLGPGPLLSVPLEGESLEGRVFFTGKPSMTSDDLVLAEIVAGVLAARLDHFYLNQRVQEAAATEERIRLARDLHDGVLQSLTGIGLRLAAVRGLLDESPQAARSSLETLQELIAREQRDLRFFIQELKPPPLAPAGEASTLAGSVSELVRRIELEWGLRAELRMQGLEGPIPEPLARDIYHVVRESLVNAVRHGEASAVRVHISRESEGALSITVADNGQGFPFQGRYSQEELTRRRLGPRTLLERVTSHQGTLTIDSSSSGARLDIAIPWPEAGI